LACTFAGEIATLPALSEWVQPRGVVFEYNPFSDEAMQGDPLPESKRYTAPGWPRMKTEEWSHDDLADAMASDRLRWANDEVG
jgi:hypothetical protein